MLMNTNTVRSIRETVMTLLEVSDGAFDLYSVFAGNRLGLYAALAEIGPATSAELSAAAGAEQKQVATWLDEQVHLGFLRRAGSASGVRFSLNPAAREALLDSDALEALCPPGLTVVPTGLPAVPVFRGFALAA